MRDGRCHELAGSGRELAALGRGGEALPMLASIGDDSVARSGRAGRRAACRPAHGAGAAQTRQIAQPDARERGIDHLVLFDIDGTLLLTPDPLYGEALVETVREVYGHEVPRESLERADHPGETAMSGLRLLLRAEGLHDEEIDRGLERWCELHARRYVELLAAGSTDHWRLAPAAVETLEELQREMRIALLTGNAEPIARARMERLGLTRFFPAGQGAFGCDAEDRAELIGIARRRAGGWPADRTALVGDTPKDIAGARAAGIAAIGVTSGRYAAAELAGADAVVAGLPELPTAIRSLGDAT